jgi:hypothetical protein
MPNGTFVGEPPTRRRRGASEAPAGLDDKPLAVFIGSLYPPNEEAAAFICTELAPALPDVTFAICGGVGSAIDATRWLGAGSPTCRYRRARRRGPREYLGAADVAVNPMFSGSGTNIKMFDFMAAGLPVVSTPPGREASPGRIGAARLRAGEFAGRCGGFSPIGSTRASRHARPAGVRQLCLGAAVAAPRDGC